MSFKTEVYSEKEVCRGLQLLQKLGRGSRTDKSTDVHLAIDSIDVCNISWCFL